jgi:hypothetical protein
MGPKPRLLMLNEQTCPLLLFAGHAACSSGGALTLIWASQVTAVQKRGLSIAGYKRLAVVFLLLRRDDSGERVFSAA